MKSLRIFTALIFVLILLGFSCKNKTKGEFEIKDAEYHDHTIDSLIKNIPPYAEIISPLEKMQLDSQSELLKYDSLALPESGSIIAIQTGIIMTDIANCYYYNEVNLAMNLYKEFEKRAKILNLPMQNIKNTTEKLEANIGNDDEIKNIISEEYNMLNNKLVDGKRVALSGLLIAGSVLESSRFVALDTVSDKEIRKNLWLKNRDLLETLKPLYESYTDDDANDVISEIYSVYNSGLNSKSGKRLNELKAEIMN